jgi:hypothetical protein
LVFSCKGGSGRQAIAELGPQSLAHDEVIPAVKQALQSLYLSGLAFKGCGCSRAIGVAMPVGRYLLDV